MQSGQGEPQRAVLFWGFPLRQEEDAEEGRKDGMPRSLPHPAPSGAVASEAAGPGTRRAFTGVSWRLWAPVPMPR